MVFGASRRWRGDFAQRLKEIEGTHTVEEAVAQLVNKKFSEFERPSPPVNLSIMASICGIDPNIATTQMQQDARLVPKNGKFYIEVNASHGNGRRRYSIAHEINHKILTQDKMPALRECDNIGSFSRATGKSIERTEEEWLCDFGASQLLLLTSAYLDPIRIDYGFSLKAIQYIEEVFEVSFEAAARSLIKTTLEEVAVVFFAPSYSKKEEEKVHQLILLPGYVDTPQPKLRIVRSYISSRFPLKLPPRKSIRDQSCIVEAFHSGETVKAKEHISFNNRDIYEVSIEAFRRAFYTKEILTEGVVAIVSRPDKIS